MGKTTSAKAWALLERRLKRYLSDPEALKQARANLRSTVPQPQASNIDCVLSWPRVSYRDALLIQTAYGVASGGKLNLTRRATGGRTVASKLGKLLADAHIKAVADAFQNIGKNTPRLTRGNFPEFDELLKWLSHEQRRPEELETVLDYACARIAATARPVQKMPNLDYGKLTFAEVGIFFRSLFQISSQGAYEQYAVAALLDGVLGQTLAGPYRVETKPLTASDKSSGTAADIQIVLGTRVIEAYEVTARDWAQKAAQAEEIIRRYDLSRMHIIAATEENREAQLVQVRRLGQDVSVLGLEEFVAVSISVLTRKSRGQALERLYQYLDRYQPDIEKVNRFVELLHQHGFADSK